jgi:glycosyltransferase involved in cell wall biosynthesis
MRLHVVSLPHTQTTGEYNQCAYTAKATRFCTMMTDLGHDVILYASEENEARCAELVTCITKNQQENMIPEGEVYEVDFDPTLPFWRHFNAKVIEKLRPRLEPHDFICLTVGDPHREIVEAYPNHIVVETGVGYEGILPSTWKVYESYAWMHAMYGKNGPTAADGRAFDAVIPNFYDVDDFPAGDGDGGYYAFLSRMTPRKGPTIAIDAAAEVGAELWVGGSGGDRIEADHVKYLGFLDAEGRAKALGGAIATFVPTQYIEPFGGVAVESMLCGTPVITSDFGAFTETVHHGVDGYRCHVMGEYVIAALAAHELDRDAIRESAISRFSTEVAGRRYELHFGRLLTLWGAGFYEGVTVR